jgi:hypothetical protein
MERSINALLVVPVPENPKPSSIRPCDSQANSANVFSSVRCEVRMQAATRAHDNISKMGEDMGKWKWIHTQIHACWASTLLF